MKPRHPAFKRHPVKGDRVAKPEGYDPLNLPERHPAFQKRAQPFECEPGLTGKERMRRYRAAIKEEADNADTNFRPGDARESD